MFKKKIRSIKLDSSDSYSELVKILVDYGVLPRAKPVVVLHSSKQDGTPFTEICIGTYVNQSVDLGTSIIQSLKCRLGFHKWKERWRDWRPCPRCTPEDGEYAEHLYVSSQCEFCPETKVVREAFSREDARKKGLE